MAVPPWEPLRSSAWLIGRTAPDRVRTRPEESEARSISQRRVGLVPRAPRVSVGEPVRRAWADNQPDVTALIPIVRRIIYSRVGNRTVAEDLVQETLVKVLGAAHRMEPGMLEPYAIVTARNVVASMWKEQDRHRRNLHRVVDLPPVGGSRRGAAQTGGAGSHLDGAERLSERERQTLLAHEVSGQDTRSLGAELGLSAGAVAAQLNRSRARLRVEYLLALQDVEPPTERCRPVLFALSGRRSSPTAGGRRRTAPAGVRGVRRAQPTADERGQQSDDEVADPDPRRPGHRPGAQAGS